MNANSNKPRCKFCFDAKKPASEYNSHSVKNNKGDTICPTLLSIQCNYCHKTGHTVSKCKMIKKTEIARRQQEQQQIAEKKAPETKKLNNIYAALGDEEDEEEEQTQLNLEAYPALNKFLNPTQSQSQSNNSFDYKNALVNPGNLVRSFAISDSKEAFPENYFIINNNSVQIIKNEEKPKKSFKDFKTRSWADDYSSDEEEEDKQEVSNDAW